jgi:hypothetical protein
LVDCRWPFADDLRATGRDRLAPAIGGHCTRAIQFGPLDHGPGGGPDRSIWAEEHELDLGFDLHEGFGRTRRARARYEDGPVPLRVLRGHVLRASPRRDGDLLRGAERRRIRRCLGPRPPADRPQEVDHGQGEYSRQEEHCGRQDRDRTPLVVIDPSVHPTS